MSSDRLSVPEVLSRPRDHAVICTFGADLDFYEGPLWRHISRARNRIVFADDVVLAAKLADLASGGSRLRHINRNYLATPITNERSAHAKLILLVDASGGTLLVGSGNISIDGYASRGEIFCRYDVTNEDSTYLPELQAAKDLLDLMAGREYLDSQARHQLNAVWGDTPWIWAPAARAPGVRHNLAVPLGEQLLAAVSGEVVAELTVHAPFHDRQCGALRRLIEGLRPEHVTVLVQPGRTSVDPRALSAVLDAARGTFEVQLAAAPEFPDTYLHAKFILVRTATRSITLTGSANLSLAALWRTDQRVGDRPAGNIELVNLAEGPPESIDELLAELVLNEPTEALAELDVNFLGDHEASSPDARPRLDQGRWVDATLTLVAAAELPPGPLTLVIAGSDVEAELAVEGKTVTAKLPSEAAGILDARVVPVWLRIATSDGDVETTPVYPYVPSALAALLNARRDPDLLRKVGSLDMEAYDDDLISLLDELDAALVIDRHSLWRLARRTPPPESSGTDGDGPRRAWEDLDFDVLRRHPRLAQYERTVRPTDRLEATDLQIVLGAITDHFRGFGTDEVPPRAVAATDAQVEGVFDVDLDDVTSTLPGDDDATPTDETIEEFEAHDEADEERERRRLKTETRNRLAWQRFSERFTRALADRDFLDVVGPRVVLANAVILNHLLFLLVAKGVVTPEKGVSYEIDLWSFLWGEEARPGFVESLPEDEQMEAMEEFSERGLEVSVLTAMDLAVQLTKQHHLEALRVRLRHVWRRMLTSPHLCFTVDVLRRASRPGIRPAAQLTSSLVQFARETTPREVQDAIAAALNTTRSRLVFREEAVQRGTARAVVEVIEVSDPAVDITAAVALKLFAAVAATDPRRDYVRVKHTVSKVVSIWDRRLPDCWWYDPAEDEPLDLGQPDATEPEWHVATTALSTAGRSADAVVA